MHNTFSSRDVTLTRFLANRILVVENWFKTGFWFAGLHRNLYFKPS